jgi:hypothetical protein
MWLDGDIARSISLLEDYSIDDESRGDDARAPLGCVNGTRFQQRRALRFGRAMCAIISRGRT